LRAGIAALIVAFAAPLFTTGCRSSSSPPPISGGTLLVTRDGLNVVAADSEHDSVSIVGIQQRAVLKATVSLTPGDVPGRVVEDGGGRVHVILRRGGAVATIDVAQGKLLSRRPVCAAPRGIAYDAKNDWLHVACMGGELVTLPAAAGDPVRTLRLDRDLRDVVVDGDRLLVSRFRSAEVLVLDGTGQLTARVTPPVVARDPFANGLPADGQDPGTRPNVAWRMIPLSGGGALLSHQNAGTELVSTAPGGYGSGSFGACFGPTSLVSASVTRVLPDLTVAGSAAFPAVLPVDVAVSADGNLVAVAAPGNLGSRGQVQQIFLFPTPTPTPAPTPMNEPPPSGFQCPTSVFFGDPQITHEVVAVAFTPDGELIAQTRAPEILFVATPSQFGSPQFGVPSSMVRVALPGEELSNDGHRLFHQSTPAGLACASCHPEGGDDGHVWNFDSLGARRTQVIRGGFLGTEPFHWNGDMRDFEMLVHEVFVSRMSATPPLVREVSELARWLNQIPAVPTSPPQDVAAVERGHRLFEDPAVGCSSCHAGPKLTNNLTVDVGTEGAFQVPSLRGVAWRAPYLHDGCAPTLRERFGPCGGGDYHGHTSHLSEVEVQDLIAYLETL
jgi:hypothetical protein